MHTSRRLRRPVAGLALGLALALTAGCSSDDDAQRRAGDPVTQSEAEVLADVLHEDFEAGGADFTLTAPFAQQATITLTGQVDFRRGIGSAQAVTRYTNGQPEESRTVFFTSSDIWFGDVPGLPDALSAAGLPPATYVKRPIASTSGTGTASLIDVLVQLVPRLSARQADDPRSITERGYTWRGSRSIDGQVVAVFRSGTGATIAVSADDHQLVQYVTRLPQQTFDVTITLSDHGEREITLPADEDTVDATAHPEVAQAVGV
ncbi:hypothetical protein [Modestobacter sp. NPDC049651]|uniref:hypothetical protein n=1 Tax=unclassified Modestobacter TaxID=2643866 RepID=UPI0033DD6646